MPATASAKLILIDGMALAYRGHFALIRNPRINSGGLNTSAAFVFLNAVLDLLKKEKPTHIAVALDTPEPTMRHEAYPEYKAQREAMPEDLAAILPYIERLCLAFNIPVLKLPGWEADDIVGTVTKRADEAGFQTIMVTPDKDYAQLVSDSCLLYKPARGGGGFDVMDPAAIKETWGIERIDQVIDILGLMGDSSDNIPGIPGIGQKTAQKLVAEFGDMETLLSRTGELKGKRKENLETYADQGRLSRQLVTIDREAPVPESLEDLQRREQDDQPVKAILAELEFRTIAKRLFGKDYELGDDLDGAGADRGEPSTITDTFHKYQLVDSDADRQKLLQALLAAKQVCFDLETDGLDAGHCAPIGVAFSFKAQEAWYLRLPDDADACRAVLEAFDSFWSNPDILKVGHNLKFDIRVLRHQGIAVQGPFFDTMLAAYLVMPENQRNMDALALELLEYRPVPISDLIGDKKGEQRSMRDVPIEELVEYAGEDADITLQLAECLRPMVEEQGQLRVLEEVENPLIPVLVDMEYEGIRVDPDMLATLSGELDEQIESDRLRIIELAGEEFNLNSPKQLGTILFEKLELSAYAKKTKTGQYKTDEHVLTRLAERHEIARAILDYRMRSKLKSTYVDALPNSIDADTGHIHTHYEQAVTATGRMQSHDPNLQNIPIRTALGQEVRKAFVPRDQEFLLLSIDYSQIELRIAAEMSGDNNLRKAFVDGIDIHTATAAHLNGVDPADVDAEMRRRAKTVNFGILYGITPFGLAERMGIPRGEGKDLIESYFASFPKVKQWLDDTVEFAKENGYVETMMGRRRYLRDINSRNGNVRKAAERLAINAPIQGTAADLIKLAMVKVQDLLQAGGYRSKMLLQVHDELVFDLHYDERDELPPKISEAMSTAIPMNVPIDVEMGIGENWLEAH